MLLNIFKFLFVDTRGYPRIFADIKKICGYPYNEYPHKYGDEYKVYIYLTSRVKGSHYPYPTRSIDIPSWNCQIAGFFVVCVMQAR